MRRPYEKKKIGKASALIFGLGAGALLATLAVMIGLLLPNLSTRLDNLSYRVLTYYRKLIPHPEYLPTPAAPVSALTTPSSGASSQIEPTLPAVLEQITNTPTSAATATPLLPTATSVPTSSLLTPTVTVTLLPPSPTATPTINVPLQPSGSSAQLNGFTHQWQTWNNCGPATITMNMSYYGRPETQVEAAQFLKPNRDDKNVSPEQLAAYARSVGLEAIVRQGGTINGLKTFLSNNIPVLAETWLVHDGDGLGHYRLVTGYDDTTGQLNTLDSLNGPDYKVSYEQFDADWRVFNRLYLVVFPPEQAEMISAIIGADLDDTVMYERLLAEAKAETELKPDDAIAYFNQGEALTRLGRYQEAITAFDQARQLGLHWRRLWYQFTPFEAYYSVGRYQDVFDLADATARITGGLEEAYYYRGLALQAMGQPGAEADFQAALEYNPNFTPAAEALNTLLEGG